MEQHFKIVAVLQIIHGAFLLLLGFVLLVILTGAGAISGDRTAMFVTGTVGVALGGFFILLSIPNFIAGFGLLKRREWARILTIVLSFFHLLNFPIGTAIGGYSLWALFSPEAKSYFV
ncbi:MAG TPA: hypothetical protein VGS96_05020 [Thermoanaerobaculia bacterium]|jgi:hypothetical protein|nr:hypothetical protein [Thermoanaerobaculia bacterium]